MTEPQASQAPAPGGELERRLASLVNIAGELVALVLMWRALDGPDPRDLARQALEGVRRRVEERAEYRAAMLETLEQVRNLPETEPPA